MAAILMVGILWAEIVVLVVEIRTIGFVMFGRMVGILSGSTSQDPIEVIGSSVVPVGIENYY